MAKPNETSTEGKDPPVDFVPSGFAFGGAVPEGVEGVYEPSEREMVEAAREAIRVERDALDRREAALEQLLSPPRSEGAE